MINGRNLRPKRLKDMNWFKTALELIGIGKNALESKAKRKMVEAESKIKIAQAKTDAEVNRINSNTTSDNATDFEAVKQLDRTWKDEFIIILFMMPVFSAAIVPFIIAYKSGGWEQLNQYTIDSFKSLNELPQWYPYVIGLILVATFGFRSLIRKLIEALIEKWASKFKSIGK